MYYKDEKWLYAQYIINNKSSYDIAKELNVTGTIIRYYLKKFNIKKDKLIITADQQNKTRQTCIKKYGTDCILKNQQIKKQIEQTNIKKYGVINPLMNKDIRKKIKQTNLEKYGVDNYSKTQEYHDKVKKTSIEKFGEEHYTRTLESKKRYEQTCLKKYGKKSYVLTDNFQKQQYLTKKKNNSFNTSKPEYKILEFLRQYYPNIKHQYKSERYPFNCDYYIPELDLYIEYNGFKGHQNEPFDENNKHHLEQLSIWGQKEKSMYKRFIYIWTISDPNKRKIAQQNDIKLLEIWPNDYKNGLIYILEKIKNV